MWRFYKKIDPRIAVGLRGRAVKFSDVGNMIGIFSTQDVTVQGELNFLITSRKGGVSEIGYEEYDQLKKNKTSTNLWREEMGNFSQRETLHLPPAKSAEPESAPEPPPARPAALKAAAPPPPPPRR